MQQVFTAYASMCVPELKYSDPWEDVLKHNAKLSLAILARFCSEFELVPAIVSGKELTEVRSNRNLIIFLHCFFLFRQSFSHAKELSDGL